MNKLLISLVLVALAGCASMPLDRYNIVSEFEPTKVEDGYQHYKFVTVADLTYPFRG